MPDQENYNALNDNINDFRPNTDPNISEVPLDANNQTNEAVDSTSEGLKDKTEIQKQNEEVESRLKDLFPNAFIVSSDASGNEFLITNNYKENEEKFGKTKIICKYGIFTIDSSNEFYDDIISGDAKVARIMLEDLMSDVYRDHPENPKQLPCVFKVGSNGYAREETIENFADFSDAEISALKDQFSAIEKARVEYDLLKKQAEEQKKKPKTIEYIMNLFK
jgi:hypothetical protein